LYGKAGLAVLGVLDTDIRVALNIQTVSQSFLNLKIFTLGYFSLSLSLFGGTGN
jgi:hypothetical protein